MRGSKFEARSGTGMQRGCGDRQPYPLDFVLVRREPIGWDRMGDGIWLFPSGFPFSAQVTHDLNRDIESYDGLMPYVATFCALANLTSKALCQELPCLTCWIFGCMLLSITDGVYCCLVVSGSVPCLCLCTGTSPDSRPARHLTSAR